MNIKNEVEKLNFKSGQYALIGGAVLSLYGIRDTNDLDLVVLPEVCEELLKNGWKKEEMEPGRFVLRKNGVDIFNNLCIDKVFYDREAEDIIKDADVVDGIPVQNLYDLMSFKKFLGRPKDLHDIELIREFLAKSK